MSIDSTTTHVPAGRLGDAALSLGTDPRADPRMIAVMEPFGLLAHAEAAPMDRRAGREQLLGFAAAAEEGFEGLFGALAAAWAPITGVSRETRSITGDGGHEITFYVHRPERVEGQLPLIYHVHGGGMVMLAGGGPLYARWRDELAAAGALVVGVEYRNGGGVLGPHPFPAGLDDCAAGLRWIHDHLDELGGTHITLTGDSGGANLVLALAIKAKREGWVEQIAGVHAHCPYILGTWDDPPADLPSLRENNAYWLNVALFPLLAEVYDPGASNDNEPTCWPLRATVDDVRGLPPHVISCAELDPLRDEGIAYHRLLLQAGVPSVGSIVLGICHVGQIMFREAMPDVYDTAVREVLGFARSVNP
jgi:acetyl esterase/lipase